MTRSSSLLYDRHLRTLSRADQLGFDGIPINEHHSIRRIGDAVSAVEDFVGAGVAA